jgi:hypothetical protein
VARLWAFRGRPAARPTRATSCAASRTPPSPPPASLPSSAQPSGWPAPALPSPSPALESRAAADLAIYLAVITGINGGSGMRTSRAGRRTGPVGLGQRGRQGHRKQREGGWCRSWRRGRGPKSDERLWPLARPRGTLGSDG